MLWAEFSWGLLLEVVSRVTHVGTAVVLVGGSVFMRFVLLPAAAQLGDEPHRALRQHVLARWRRVVMVGILLLLASGLYNYLVVAAPRHTGDGPYHGLMGAKILLALAMFFLASALTGRSEALQSFRANSKRWLLVLIALAAIVVALGGFLKVRGVAATPTTRSQR